MTIVVVRFLWQHDLRPRFREGLKELSPRDVRLLLHSVILFGLGWMLLILGLWVL